MSTLRSLTTCARPVNRLLALALSGLALSFALIVGSSPAYAARRPGAAPSQTTKAPPVIPAQTRNALLSQLARSLSKLGRGPTLQQLKALGLRPASRQQVARFKQLQSRHLARAATAGATYWYTWQYSGNIWVDDYYSGPYFTDGATDLVDGSFYSEYYIVYDNFKTCTSSGGDCLDASAYTYQIFGYLTPDLTPSEVGLRIALADPTGWYWQGPSELTQAEQLIGYGPYAG